MNKIAHSWAAWPILFLVTFLAAAPGVFFVPALDRDESRFAQASKEMLEEGDYIRIQYQESLRNKKPAGIHWMQAGATYVLSDDYKQIWTYRVPSWLGATFATLATFWLGIALIGRRAAFFGALLFGSGVLLTSEAHISKTDGQLVFWTTLSLGVLARFYLGQAQGKRKMLAMLFWFAIGVNALIKGPVGPMVVAFTGVGAWFLDRCAGRKTGQWRGLFWWPGPLLTTLMFVPWLIWIQWATRGEYVKGAVGKDLWDKFFSFSEGHWGIPGYHLGFMPLMFLPATLFVVPAIFLVWRHWRAKPAFAPAPMADAQAVRFLVCWVGLTWIFFELLLTKLSHYILPAYPGLALLCGWAYCVMSDKLSDKNGLGIAHWLSLFLFAIGGAVWLAIASPWVLNSLIAEAAGDFRTANANVILERWNIRHEYAVLLVLPVLIFLGAVISYALKKWQTSMVLAVTFTFVFGWYMRIVALPTANWVQPTEMLRQSLADACGLPGGIDNSPKCWESIGEYEEPEYVEVFGYAEPSFLLTLGTQNLHSPQSQMAPPDIFPSVYVFNIEEDIGAEAKAYFESLEGYCRQTSLSHFALNYSNGSPVHFIAMRFYGRQPCPSL